MNRLLLAICLHLLFISSSYAQDMVAAANKFISSLDAAQKGRALYPFDVEERYGFHFFPIEDRKGITLNELSASQKEAAIALLKTCLSEEGVKKAKEIMELEVVLKALEHRKADDHYRDPGKYYVAIFGIPANNTIWGWRFEGHHVSYNFSADEKKLVAGTPGFFGANPAIVPEGPQKGKQVLKEEADMAFALLHSLTKEALKKVLIDTIAPNEIITFISRKAMLQNPAGIRYSEMTPSQQQEFLQLIKVYVGRYTKLFAGQMLKEIQQAGLENLRFAWAGCQEPLMGKAHYYRIQGPTLIIEYDNSQNKANHVHSVIRDLKNDFGGDLLLEHYKSGHQAN
jgi:Protein of unknown function (DUF3500)